MSKSEEAHPLRQRIVEATFAVLMERGYAGASTLEIARRARVSKRELYAQFGNKAGILEALVSDTALRMQAPLQSPQAVSDRASLRTALVDYGVTALTELTSPHVVAIHRLAAAEAGRSSGELGRILDKAGREPNRRALVSLLAHARDCGLMAGDSGIMAGQFFNLLAGDILQRLMLGVVRAPRPAEIKARAEAAADAVIRLGNA